MSTPTDANVTIVGAGPYGLSAAAHLRALGVPFRILGIPMSAWRDHMPNGMFLRSEGFASSLSDPEDHMTIGRYCREHGLEYGDYAVPVPLETFLGYGRWFQRQAVPEVEEVLVSSLRRRPGGFDLTLENGERFTSRRVVVACGPVPFARMPSVLRSLGPERATHTSDHSDLAGFAGRDVAVIGKGQSALETAALLNEAGARTHLLARRLRLHWNPDPVLDRSLNDRIREPIAGLGSGWACWLYSNAPAAFYRLPARSRVRRARHSLGPSGAWWLRGRVEGRVSVHLQSEVVSARPENGGVRLVLAHDDGGSSEIVTDHVIAGTGYRVDVTRLRFISPGLMARLRRRAGAPVLSTDFESSVPGLYFLGLAAANTYGPVCRFVYGARFSARRASRHLLANLAA